MVERHRRDSIGEEKLKPEGYWSLREMFIDSRLMIPESDGIVGRLAGLRYRFKQ